jgi:hypothetical protein
MTLRSEYLPPARALLACLLIACPPAWAGDGPAAEIDVLREELRQMRADYESRIADLEARLDAAPATKP